MFFGFGTILSTAFIHMLVPANEYFTSPCLGGVWENYEGWAFMFCVAAIMGMQLLDYVAEGLTDAHLKRRKRRAAATEKATVGGTQGRNTEQGGHAGERGAVDDTEAAYGTCSTAGDSSSGTLSGNNVEVSHRSVREIAEDELELSRHHLFTEVRGLFSTAAGAS